MDLEHIKTCIQMEFLEEAIKVLEVEVTQKQNIADKLQNDVFQNRLNFCEYVRQSIQANTIFNFDEQINQNSVFVEKIDEISKEIERVENDLKEFGDLIEVKKLQHENELCNQLFEEEIFFDETTNQDFGACDVEMKGDYSSFGDCDSFRTSTPVSCANYCPNNEINSYFGRSNYELADNDTLIELEQQPDEVVSDCVVNSSKFKFKLPSRSIEN